MSTILLYLAPISSLEIHLVFLFIVFQISLVGSELPLQSLYYSILKLALLSAS